jgi:hypothetical protein
MTDTTPVACTLSAAGLAAQGKRWRQLMARAMTERAETADGLRISFRPGIEDELRALATVETECCPWASWTVEQTTGTLVLHVRSAGAGVTALHSIFTASRPGQSPGRTSPS